ncbi:MAG: hypothetical protein ACKN9S_05210 [Pirellula sp.]
MKKHKKAAITVDGNVGFVVSIDLSQERVGFLDRIPIENLRIQTSYQDVKDWAHRLVRWQEEDCVHKKDSGYLAGRDMRQANRILTGLESLEQWQMFWEQAPGGQSTVRSARQE